MCVLERKSERIWTDSSLGVAAKGRAIDSADGPAIMSNEVISFVIWKSRMKMSIFNQKISLPLLVVFLSAAIGALSGQFIWTLVAAVGAGVLIGVVRNLSSFHQAIDAGRRGIHSGTGAVTAGESCHGKGRLQIRNDEVFYSPAYKGTPGNIWNEPVSARDD